MTFELGQNSDLTVVEVDPSQIANPRYQPGSTGWAVRGRFNTIDLILYLLMRHDNYAFWFGWPHPLDDAQNGDLSIVLTYYITCQEMPLF